jgi:hypothetical protein
MTPDEIKKLVNDAYEGVDRSHFGPIFQYPDSRDVTVKQVNQLAFGVFTIILTGMIRNVIEKK